MSGFSVRIEDTEARRLIGAMADRLEDMEPLMETIGIVMSERARMQFIEQRDPWGTPWQPLSPLTQMLRRKGPRANAANQILRDTNRLMNSITYRASSKRVAVGTNAIYAAIHQLGGTVRPKRGRFLWAGEPGGPRIPLKKAVIPARPFLPFDETRADLPPDWQRDLIETLQAWLGAPP